MSDILQEAEFLIEKHATSGYIHRDATLLLPGLVEEIKRLQADNDFLHKFVDDPGSTLEAALNAVREQSEVIRKQQAAFADAIKTAAATLTKWQQIAIEERAKQMNEPCDFRTKYEWCDNRQASCDGFPHMWECCPNKDHWRSIAAKELGLQVKQEAGYVDRLERLALSICIEAGWDQEDFEAALEKIRGG